MNVDLKILDARLRENMPAYATPAAPDWTCAPVWMRR
jgi:hypothetical protein